MEDYDCFFSPMDDIVWYEVADVVERPWDADSDPEPQHVTLTVTCDTGKTSIRTVLLFQSRLRLYAMICEGCPHRTATSNLVYYPHSDCGILYQDTDCANPDKTTNATPVA